MGYMLDSEKDKYYTRYDIIDSATGKVVEPLHWYDKYNSEKAYQEARSMAKYYKKSFSVVPKKPGYFVNQLTERGKEESRLNTFKGLAKTQKDPGV